MSCLSGTSIPSDLTQCTTKDIKSLIDMIMGDYNESTGTFNTGTYRTYIPTFLNELQKLVSSNPATTLQNTNNQLLQLEDDIIKTKEDLRISKDRVNSLRESNKQSYYESWFPINRPLRSSTNIILLGIGIFFFTLTFFIILHSMGFALNINILWGQEGSDTSLILDKLRILFPFGIMPTLLIIGLAITAGVLGFLRKT